MGCTLLDMRSAIIVLSALTLIFFVIFQRIDIFTPSLSVKNSSNSSLNTGEFVAKRLSSAIQHVANKAINTGQHLTSKIKNLLSNEDELTYSKTLYEHLQSLNRNAIYSFYNLTVPKRREKYNLVVFISSAPGNVAIRNAVRDTWFSQCNSNSNTSVKCVFLTDKFPPSHKLYKRLNEEQEEHKDMHFQVSLGAMDFGGRLLYQLYYTYLTYDFEYFLHLDDDYFFCLEKLLSELPLPMKSLQYGYIHCYKDIVRIDEGFYLLSRDILKTIVTWDPHTLPCHNFGGQQIGLWNEVLSIPQPYFTDRRLHHDPAAETMPRFKRMQNICHTQIALHGVSALTIRNMWTRRGKLLPATPSRDLFAYTSTCPYPKKFKWQNFSTKWRIKPALCKEHVKWGKQGQSYGGRG